MTRARKVKAVEAVADRHVMRLYKAVQNYVERAGGSVVVVGGIQIQEWPGDMPAKFTVAIKCMGRKPKYASDAPIRKRGGK